MYNVDAKVVAAMAKIPMFMKHLYSVYVHVYCHVRTCTCMNACVRRCTLLYTVDAKVVAAMAKLPMFMKHLPFI